VARLAREKAAALQGGAGHLILAADTAVVLAADILGKPQDKAEAARMLRALSGKKHQVKTGICARLDDALQTEVVTTDVTFRELGPAEIARYLEVDECMDKAGAYAIQGKAGAFVDQISGSYTNVVGLPLQEVLALAKSL
jgi:septum formation protein